MKQIFKIKFYVPNFGIKENVFNYLRSHEISFNYETCGQHIGGYTFSVWNVTQATIERLFIFMKKVCSSDFKFNASISLCFVEG